MRRLLLHPDPAAYVKAEIEDGVLGKHGLERERGHFALATDPVGLNAHESALPLEVIDYHDSVECEAA